MWLLLVLLLWSRFWRQALLVKEDTHAARDPGKVLLLALVEVHAHKLLCLHWA